VVIKSGDGANRPGSGFFELEKALGRDKADADEDVGWRSWMASSSIGRNTETQSLEDDRGEQRTSRLAARPNL
jgi:hypothetical protein